MNHLGPNTRRDTLSGLCLLAVCFAGCSAPLDLGAPYPTADAGASVCRLCDPLASCVAEGDSLACICPPGFRDRLGDGRECVDRDECEAGSPCGDDTCVNHAGGFTCQSVEPSATTWGDASPLQYSRVAPGAGFGAKLAFDGETLLVADQQAAVHFLERRRETTRHRFDSLERIATFGAGAPVGAWRPEVCGFAVQGDWAVTAVRWEGERRRGAAPTSVRLRSYSRHGRRWVLTRERELDAYRCPTIGSDIVGDVAFLVFHGERVIHAMGRDSVPTRVAMLDHDLDDLAVGADTLVAVARGAAETVATVLGRLDGHWTPSDEWRLARTDSSFRPGSSVSVSGDLATLRAGSAVAVFHRGTTGWTRVPLEAEIYAPWEETPPVVDFHPTYSCSFVAARGDLVSMTECGSGESKLFRFDEGRLTGAPRTRTPSRSWQVSDVALASDVLLLGMESNPLEAAGAGVVDVITHGEARLEQTVGATSRGRSFGRSVALAGDHAIIGSHGLPGPAFLFDVDAEEPADAFRGPLDVPTISSQPAGLRSVATDGSQVAISVGSLASASSHDWSVDKAPVPLAWVVPLTEDGSYGPAEPLMPREQTDRGLHSDVAIDGDRAVVAIYERVYAFAREDERWVQTAVLEDVCARATSVALHGDHLAIASATRTCFYRWSDGRWSLGETLPAPAGPSGSIEHWESWDADIDGDWAAVGRTGHHPITSGEVAIFYRGATGWEQAARLEGSTRYFGTSVALFDGELLVGQPVEAPRAMVYQRVGDSWRLRRVFRSRDLMGFEESSFGAAVDLQERGALLGAPEASDHRHPEVGAAWLIPRAPVE